MKLSSTGGYVIALTSGTLLWIGTMAISGRNEAWDSPLYWSLAYPACMALTGWLAYQEPMRS